METPNNDYRIIRWISFSVVTILFVASGVRAIIDGSQIDKALAGIFLVIIGTAWGANLWKTFIK